MRVLITGITGYIGSHLAKDCLQRGWTVAGIARANSKTELLKKNNILSKIKLYRVQEGVGSVRKALQKAKPDVVIHLATLYISEHREDQVASLIDSNIHFGAELLEAMRLEGVRSLVNAETTWQYNPQGKVQPVNLYAATKEAFAVINSYYCDAYGLKTIKFKLFDTYGGNDNRPKLFNKFKEILRTGETLELSKGEQIVDFTHIDDVTQVFCLGIERVRRLNLGVNEEYVITGERHSLRKWIQIINEITGRKLPVVLGAKPYRKREVMKPWSKGKKIKGWKARVSSKIGFKEFFNT